MMADGHLYNHSMKTRTRRPQRPVAFWDGTVVVEPSMPMPWVHYPGHYGSYFAFSDREEGALYLWACSRVSLENFARFRSGRLDQHHRHGASWLVSARELPLALREQCRREQDVSAAALVDGLPFREQVCHECNRSTPQLAYCAPMYGGAFMQSYGWYVRKELYAYGVEPLTCSMHPDARTEEIFLGSGVVAAEFHRRFFGPDGRPLIPIGFDSEFQKWTRRIRNVVENEVRARFGFKPVGEAWATETLLFNLVRESLVGQRVLRHFRATWLNRLELDIYLPDLKLAIEYQGIQHSQPLPHWGGEEALRRNQERDALKAELCRAAGVELICFYHDEPIGIDVVRSRLARFIESASPV